jgi:hypothetical protein
MLATRRDTLFLLLNLNGKNDLSPSVSILFLFSPPESPKVIHAQEFKVLHDALSPDFINSFKLQNMTFNVVF